MPAIAVLRVGIRATNRQDPQRVRRGGPSGRKAAEKPRAHEGKGHGPRRREGSRDAALPSQDPQRVRQRGLQESRVRKERGATDSDSERASCAARRPGKRIRDAALPSQGPRTASRPWEDSRAHGGSDGQRWDSGTASRAPMPASRQPTASRFLGSVVRGFVPLLQLTRRPLRDILLQPCDDIPLGFFHGAGIGGGLAALSDRCCWSASGRAGR